MTVDLPNRIIDSYNLNHNFHSKISEDDFVVIGASVFKRGELVSFTFADYFFKQQENIFNVGIFLYNSMLGYRMGVQRNIHES